MKRTFMTKYINKGVSYNAYRNIVEKLVDIGATSGNNKTEDLATFTKLNDRRMKRWDKTLKVPSDVEDQIRAFDHKIIWLVLTESWCGDAAHLLPIFNKVASLNDNIELKIVFRDENEELMNAFLTNGNRSIPKLIMIDSQTNQVLKTYGPRPNILTKMVDDFKAEHGKLTPEFKEELQVWYNKDKGQTTLEELAYDLCELQPAICLETKM